MSPSTTKPSRTLIFKRVVVSCFALAALSQARVQVVQRDGIIDRAIETERFLMTSKDLARRGSIFTADGKPLAQDEDTGLLTIEPQKVPHSDAFYLDLAAACGIPASELAAATADGTRAKVWPEPLTSDEARRVRAVKSKWRADGLSLSRGDGRAYPLAEVTSGFVGYMRNGKGVAGLELSLEKVLSGVDGKIVGLLDRTGNYLPMRLDKQTVRSKDGENVILTIDSELQAAAAVAIKAAVDANRADQGAAIVLDPKTGDILAMANWPSYDPEGIGGIRPSDSLRTEFNPNYMASLEPGSTFKILTVAAALDMGAVQPSEHIYCNGAFVVRNRALKCDLHGGTRAHGQVDPEKAIAKSCNVNAATWATRIGYQRFVKFMEDLGLLKKTSLGVAGEIEGQFNYGEYAKDLQLATLGFGQSVNTTPVALASAFSMLANQGLRMEPRLIRKIGATETKPVEGGQIVSPESAQQVLNYMEAVIESDMGTGKSLRIPGYRLGGKTGTAQKIGKEGYVANFVGFVPAQKPRAVILVMVDHPKAGKYYGASVAGPVFVDMAKAVIRRFGIPPTDSAFVSGDR